MSRQPAPDGTTAGAGPRLEVGVVHASPGRVRIRVAQATLDSEAFHLTREALMGLPGVRGVRTNPLARSLVVTYDPQALAFPDLLALAARAGVTISGQEGATEGKPGNLNEAVTTVFDRADRRMAELTRGSADLRTLVPLSLGVLAAREVMAGRLAAAPWYVLAWYAFDSFVKLRKPDASGE